MIRTALGTILSTIVSALPLAAEPLSDKQIIAAVRDLSNGNERAIAIATSTLWGNSPVNSVFSDLLEDQRAFAALAISLDAVGRLAWLDWTATTEESRTALTTLFRSAGLDPSGAVAALESVRPEERGDAVGRAYLAFRTYADAAKNAYHRAQRRFRCLSFYLSQ